MTIDRMEISSLLAEPDLSKLISLRGWILTSVLGDEDFLSDQLQALSLRLGVPKPGRAGKLVERLSPVVVGKANRSSLSIQYGLSSFPWHTDGAHLASPHRFILLACVNPGRGSVPTLFANIDDLALTAELEGELSTMPYLVKNGRRSFFTTIKNRHRPFVRFDSGCMIPQSQKAEAVMHFLTDRASHSNYGVVDWSGGDIVIVDNWHVLHRRGLKGQQSSPDRTLLRMNIQ